MWMKTGAPFAASLFACASMAGGLCLRNAERVREHGDTWGREKASPGKSQNLWWEATVEDASFCFYQLSVHFNLHWETQLIFFPPGRKLSLSILKPLGLSQFILLPDPG